MQISDNVRFFLSRQKWLVNSCFYFCLVLTIGSLIFCRLDGADNLTQANCISIGADMVSLAICTTLLYSCKQDKDMNSGHTQIFVFLITMEACEIFTDMASWLVSGSPKLILWNKIFCVGNYVSATLLVFFFWRYVATTLELEGKLVSALNLLMNLLIIPDIISSCVNFFYPLHFSIDAEGIYHRESMYMLSHVYNVVAVAAGVIGFIKSKSAPRVKIITASFILIPIFAQIMSGYNPGLTTQYSAMLVSIVLIYGVLFAEREMRLVATEKELSMATSIQSSVMPNMFPAFPEREEFDIYASMDPAKEVGGDFYDFFFVDNDHLAMVIADVSGKGIPAALFMMSAKIVINDRTMMGGTPAEILKYANNRICDKNEEGLFVTVWLGILDLRTGKLICANAGHEFPALCRNGKFELFQDEHGFVVGGFEDEEYTDYEIQLSPGDKIFVYTDGVPEATDAKGEMFNTDRMTESLNKHRDLSPEHLLKAVKEDVKEFVKDAPQFDDLTMLTLTFKGSNAGKDGFNE